VLIHVVISLSLLAGFNHRDGKLLRQCDGNNSSRSAPALQLLELVHLRYSLPVRAAA
jgi:hypothetical protein